MIYTVAPSPPLPCTHQPLAFFRVLLSPSTLLSSLRVRKDEEAEPKQAPQGGGAALRYNQYTTTKRKRKPQSFAKRRTSLPHPPTPKKRKSKKRKKRIQGWPELGGPGRRRCLLDAAREPIRPVGLGQWCRSPLLVFCARPVPRIRRAARGPGFPESSLRGGVALPPLAAGATVRPAATASCDRPLPAFAALDFVSLSLSSLRLFPFAISTAWSPASIFFPNSFLLFL